jgi:hypothetical protein
VASQADQNRFGSLNFSGSSVLRSDFRAIGSNSVAVAKEHRMDEETRKAELISAYKRALTCLLTYSPNSDPGFDRTIKENFYDASIEIERHSLAKIPEYQAAVLQADDDARSLLAKPQLARATNIR